MSISEALAQVWPPLVLLTLILAMLEMILRRTTWLSRFEAPLRSRLASLDGLRAFLAYGVVMCHVGTFFYFYRGVPWGPHPNPYYHQAGAASVRLFFMITGFLFWSKAILGNGRVDPLRLYWNRFWRIMPLYGTLIAAVVVIALVATSQLNESPSRIVGEIAELVVPGYRTEGVINGFDYTEFLRQTWTLKWELVFYGLIPLMGIGARSLPSFCFLAFLLLAITAGLHRFLPALEISITMNFLVGMVAAHLKARYNKWSFARTFYASAVAVVIAAVAPFVVDGVSIYLGNLLYAVLFVLVLYGTDVFGLLTARSSRVLGEISYSVYLLHMLVLVLVIRALDRLHPIGHLSHEAFWLYSAVPVVAIVGLSLLTFRFVELPGIARGHRRTSNAV